MTASASSSRSTRAPTARRRSSTRTQREDERVRSFEYPKLGKGGVIAETFRAVGRGARRLRRRRRRDAAARDAAPGRRGPPTSTARSPRAATRPRCCPRAAARPRDHQRGLRRQRPHADGPAVPRHAVRRQGAAPRRGPRRAPAPRLARPAVRRRPAGRRPRRRLARGRGPDGVDRPGGLARQHGRRLAPHGRVAAAAVAAPPRCAGRGGPVSTPDVTLISPFPRSASATAASPAWRRTAPTSPARSPMRARA